MTSTSTFATKGWKLLRKIIYFTEHQIFCNLSARSENRSTLSKGQHFKYIQLLASEIRIRLSPNFAHLNIFFIQELFRRAYRTDHYFWNFSLKGSAFEFPKTHACIYSALQHWLSFQFQISAHSVCPTQSSQFLIHFKTQPYPTSTHRYWPSCKILRFEDSLWYSYFFGIHFYRYERFFDYDQFFYPSMWTI